MKNEIDNIFGDEFVQPELSPLKLVRDKAPGYAQIQVHCALHQRAFLGQKNAVFLLQ